MKPCGWAEVGGHSGYDSSYDSSQGSAPSAFGSSSPGLRNPAQPVTWLWLPLRVWASNLSWAACKECWLRRCGGTLGPDEGLWLAQPKSLGFQKIVSITILNSKTILHVLGEFPEYKLLL